MIGKDYLGDSVYVNFDGYAIVLTTENGREASNTIVLEPSVFLALIRYNQRLIEAIESNQNEIKPF